VGQAVRIVVQPIDSLLSLSWPRRLSWRPFPVWHSEAARFCDVFGKSAHSVKAAVVAKAPMLARQCLKRGRPQKAKRAEPFPPMVCVVSISDHF
jgi:hypothetical protein